MIARFLSLSLVLSFALSHVTTAQRRLPYPILFVHGFAGKAANW